MHMHPRSRYDGLALQPREADDLHELLLHLGTGPALLYGSSSGARTGMIVALRHPQAVAAMVLAPPTGGAYPARLLAKAYYTKHCSHVGPVSAAGMEPLLRTKFFAARLAEHREIDGSRGERAARHALLSTDPKHFRGSMLVSEQQRTVWYR